MGEMYFGENAMQRVTVICVGKLKEKFYAEAAAEYAKRLSRYCKLELALLRWPKSPRTLCFKA